MLLDVSFVDLSNSVFDVAFFFYIIIFSLINELFTSVEHVNYYCSSAHTQRNIDAFATCPY